jgi:hypothetical protein
MIIESISAAVSGGAAGELCDCVALTSAGFVEYRSAMKNAPVNVAA